VLAAYAPNDLEGVFSEVRGSRAKREEPGLH